MTTILATNNYAGSFNNLVEVNNLATWAVSEDDVMSFTLSEVASPGAGDVGATRIVFNGSGFNSYTGNFANTGTITVINVYEWDGGSWTKTADWTNMSVSAATLLAAIENPDQSAGDTAFINAIFGGDDTITGANSFEDELSGYGGADTIRGLNGNDTISGGDGADTLFGDYGLDVVNGGAGNDTIYAYTAYDPADNLLDTLDGGADTDTLLAWGVNPAGGNSEVDLRYATISNMEHITFAPQANNVTSISLSLTAAQVASNFTAPTITGTLVANCGCFINIEGITSIDLSGWTFVDWDTNPNSGDAVSLFAADTGAVIYTNDDTATRLFGGTGADELHGGAQADRLYASNLVADGSADNMYGGNGDDFYVVWELSDVVHELANEGQDYAAVYANNFVMPANLESMAMWDGVFVATGNNGVNSILGDYINAKSETMYGLGGADSLLGYGANDTLIGGAGGDFLSGGDGIDTASYITAAAAVAVNLTSGATAGADAIGDVFVDVENLFGTNFNDNFVGNALANRLTGGEGNDTLDGRVGADTLIGGNGNDTYVVDNAGDITSEGSPTGGTDLVRSSVTRTLTAYIENLTLLGAAAINGTGNSLANTITGNAAANTLNGAAGADTMIGGNGNDTYIVDNAGDVTTESSAAGGIDLVQSSVTRTLGANLENLTLTGSAAINGTGNTLANVLTGNNGANTLNGGSGADTLIGGVGVDTLTGGAGGDKFVLNAAPAAVNADIITDFIRGSDKVQLENAVLTALGATTGTLAAAKFWVGTGAHDADDRIIYDNVSGKLYYDSNGNVGGGKVLIATLDAGLALTNTDFQVI